MKSAQEAQDKLKKLSREIQLITVASVAIGVLLTATIAHMCHIVERDVVTIERVTYGRETTLTTEHGAINAGDDRRFEAGDNVHVGKNRAGQWVLVNPK